MKLPSDERPFSKSSVGVTYAVISLLTYLLFSTACNYYTDINVVDLFFIFGLQLFIIAVIGHIITGWRPPSSLYFIGCVAALMEVLDFLGRVLCYRALPIHVALAVNYCTPVWATILEPWFVPGEYAWPMNFHRFLCSIVICMAIAADGYGSDVDWNSETWVGVVAGLGSACFRVSQNLLVRNRVRDVDVHIPFYFWNLQTGLLFIASAQFAYRFNLTGPMSLKREDLFINSTIAFVAIIGWSAMLLSHDYIPASDAIVIRTLEIPLGGIVGILLLDESVNFISGTGWIVAFLGCAFMHVKLSKQHQHGDEKDNVNQSISFKSAAHIPSYGLHGNEEDKSEQSFSFKNASHVSVSNPEPR